MRNGEEDHQDLAVGNLRGIKGDADGFRMAGEAAADHFVAGRIHAAAGIACGHGADAFEVLEYGLHAPEAAAGEDGSLLRFACRERSIDGRLWEWVVRLGRGATADQAGGVPCEKGGDDGDRQSAADGGTAHPFRSR